MARKPRGTNAEKEQELELLKALRFVAVAQRDEGTPYQTHCRFENGYVVAFDGILAAGYPVSEGMAGCPNTLLLVDALSHVRGAFSLTLMDNHNLAVVSGEYRGLVPCIRQVEIEPITGDAPNYALDDSFKLAALEAGTLCTDGATTVIGASVLTLDHSVIGTNGLGFVERLHKGHTPSGLCLPMAFVKAVAACTLSITKFGFTNGSFTAWFENGAWIKTQLYQEQYPNLDRIFEMMQNHACTPIPEKLITAVKAVERFTETGVVWIDKGQ